MTIAFYSYRSKCRERVVRLLAGFFFLLLVPAVHAKEPSSASSISVQVLKRHVTDVPIQTLVRVDLLVTGKPTEAQLRALLVEQYEIANRRRYKHHSLPTTIQVAIFQSREHAASGMGQWLALLNFQQQMIPRPEVRINVNQLRNLGRAPEIRFGLTEAQRKKVFKDYVLAQDLADSRGVDSTPYEDAVARKYRLSRKQLDTISAEAKDKDWPLPGPK